MDQSELLNLWAGNGIFIYSIVIRVVFFSQFIAISVLLNVTTLADIKKEKCIFHYQMNINLSFYLNINQTKKITKTKTSIMYNQ